jgi:hypothetical protein
MKLLKKGPIPTGESGPLMRVIMPILVVTICIAVGGCIGPKSTTSTNPNPIVPKGYIVLSISRPEPSQEIDVIRPMLIPPEATNIRIRIFNESQNIVRDVKIPSEGTTMVRIDLPAAVYNIHALAYLIANSNEGVVLTAGEARNITVNPNEYSHVSMTLERPEGRSITTEKDTVMGGSAFKVTYMRTSDALFKDQSICFILRNGPWRETDISKPSLLVDEKHFYVPHYNTSDTIELTAPSVTEETTGYYQAQQVIDYFLYSPGNIQPRYLYIYTPCAISGDPLGKVTFLPPSGGISLEIK